MDFKKEKRVLDTVNLDQLFYYLFVKDAKYK